MGRTEKSPRATKSEPSLETANHVTSGKPHRSDGKPAKRAKSEKKPRHKKKKNQNLTSEPQTNKQKVETTIVRDPTEENKAKTVREKPASPVANPHPNKKRGQKRKRTSESKPRDQPRRNKQTTSNNANADTHVSHAPISEPAESQTKAEHEQADGNQGVENRPSEMASIVDGKRKRGRKRKRTAGANKKENPVVQKASDSKDVTDAKKSASIMWSDLVKSEKAAGGGPVQKRVRKEPMQKSKTEANFAAETADGEGDDHEEAPASSEANGKEESSRGPDKDDRLGRTVFVGNVPQKARHQDIEKLFKPFGRIESVRIRGVTPVNPKLPKKMAFLTQNFAEFAGSHQAYVVFAEDQDFQKAMDNAIEQLNMSVYFDHHLRVKPAAQDPLKIGTRRVSVFVGNLPFDCQEEELITAFQNLAEQTGVKVVDARVNRDKETGAGRGIGFVSFDDKIAVQACLNEAGSLKIRGRVLRIEAAQKEKKFNTKTFKKQKRRAARTLSKG